jgi:hypothetical protein
MELNKDFTVLASGQPQPAAAIKKATDMGASTQYATIVSFGG